MISIYLNRYIEKIRTGKVNKNFGRSGGGTQFQLLDNVEKGWSDVTPF
jgi:filamentous hemagglutinin